MKGIIMNLLHCWLCEANLIWGGEQDLKDNEDYHVVTNLSCPNCNSLVHIYHPKPKNDAWEENSVA